jgi:hypothetical protein
MVLDSCVLFVYERPGIRWYLVSGGPFFWKTDDCSVSSDLRLCGILPLAGSFFSSENTHVLFADVLICCISLCFHLLLSKASLLSFVRFA